MECDMIHLSVITMIARDYIALVYTWMQVCLVSVVRGDRNGLDYCNSTRRSPPHIIYILADDLGFNDISWNNPDVDTPNLHALAQSGIILDQNYMGSTCTPSRAALLTGRYPFRLGLQHNSLISGESACLPLTVKLLPAYLHDIGYQTHLLGKWGLGFSKWACTPLYRGFDTFYGFYSDYIDHYTHQYPTFGKSGYDFRDGNEVDLEANGTYTQDLLTSRALDIIGSHDCASPMFLLLASPLVHYPVQVPPGVQEDMRNTEQAGRANYLAMVAHLDKAVGQVVAALKDKGLYNNSVIIFSSDNGAQADFVESSGYPLRGAKGDVYEGGTRVPGMVHSPLMEPEAIGTVSRGVIHATDWIPTILALAGVSETIDGLDGVDQRSLILGRGESQRSEMVYNVDQISPQFNGAGALRMGDFKLVVGFPGLYDGWEQVPPGVCFTYQLNLLENSSSPGTCMDLPFVLATEASVGYILDVSDNVMLFNLIDDPSEFVDLAECEPELVATMRGRLEELRAQAVPVDESLFYIDPESLPDRNGGVWGPFL